MTKLLLASELTEARKFSRDDRLRSSTPGPEAVRLKTPALSQSWALISFVVVYRSADGDWDYHRAIGIKRRYDERDRRSKAQGCHPAQGAGVDACTQIAQCLTSAQLDGSRAGSKQVGDFTKAFVDAVYAKLLVVESLDAEGNVVRRERRRMAIAAMGACRRAWFVMQRAEQAIVPADNPFAKMGLKKLAPGQKKTETPTATWDELVAFRNAALGLGYPSIATAALTAWEWLQREEHLFGAFEIVHYRPKGRPNSACVVNPKTGEQARW